MSNPDPGTSEPEKAVPPNDSSDVSPSASSENIAEPASTLPVPVDASVAVPDSAAGDEPSSASGSAAGDQPSSAADSAAGGEPGSLSDSAGRRTFSKIHLSTILDEVLEESAETAALPEEERKKLRYPMFLDVSLGLGLLVAMAGFTTGLFHMYLVHAAADCINKANYEAAVVILRGAPLPQVFSMPGSDTEELMSQALYLDSLEKTQDGRVQAAIQQLRLIKPGSKFFAGAQHLIGDNTEKAELLLEGRTETIETSPGEEKKSVIEKALQSED